MQLASKIAGVGAFLPDKKITNKDAIAILHNESRGYLNDEELATLDERVKYLLAKAGSDTRYWCKDDEYCTDIAREASNIALKNAGVDAADLDMIIFTGVTKAFIEPATAHILRHEIGAVNSNVIDTQDACTSFMKSIDLADSLIKTGKNENILIVCGEVHHSLDFRCKTIDELNWKFGALTLGDCAGAIVLQKTTEPMYTENFYHMKSFYELAANTFNLCHIGLNYRIGDVNRLYSNSSKLFRTAMEVMFKLVEKIKVIDGWQDYKNDLLIFHDIGKLIADEIIPMVRKEGLFHFPDNVISFFHKYGNVASASLPVGLHIAIKEDRVKRGDTVNFFCGAAGVQAGLLSFVY